MANQNKFEEMLEKLVNEDKAGAEELFHEIVVEKSRDIYEGLLESELEVDETTDEEVDETTDEEVDEASDEEVDEAADEETDESSKSEAETMREYVEKVTAKMGDNGANSKSPVASANDMGGDASNLVAGGEADTKGTTGGLAAPSEKEENAGNVNVPGGKAAKSNKAMPKGHGAEKKGAGDTAANKKPVIGG